MTNPSLSLENIIWNQGVQWVAGIDEAGRGALAGPVTAAAVILPPFANILKALNGVRDSKMHDSPAARPVGGPIRTAALAVGVGFAFPEEIDSLGIVPATQLAAQRALDQLLLAPEHLLLDYLYLPENPIPQTAVVKGDQRCLSIAAASVLAKTSRDAYLVALDDAYPKYGLAAHKGYGTAAHRAALQQHGPTPVHRCSFAGVDPSPNNR